MARQDAGTMFRSLPTTQTLGDYNGVSRVGPSTTFHATGSRAGAGFIIENVTNVVIHCASGGSLDGDQCTVKVLYPIGVKKVVNGSSGIVHVLHR
jgi:hypothetical protein